MSGHEHAEAALAALERIDGVEHDEAVRDAHQNALAAVDELAEALADNEADEIEIEAPTAGTTKTSGKSAWMTLATTVTCRQGRAR
ncbi:hypothetical protein [Haloarcula argentinensis]|uniref:hypothetical protein n=1 Tax=Haloarcula argentinensis TaxID=43776 RepID=UPI0002AFACD7|nr:hypothetical protein [Haloarcula argentinensis]EMA25675.1 hypothetical protein C443_02659 [Haloarcula argentinensis DSM 12282]